MRKKRVQNYKKILNRQNKSPTIFANGPKIVDFQSLAEHELIAERSEMGWRDEGLRGSASQRNPWRNAPEILIKSNK
jgi:hypothetical protein